MVPVHVGDGGASFAIGRMVVQFIIRAEAFALGTGADTAGEVQFASGHVFPNARKGMEISRVAGQCGHVGHAGIQVTGRTACPTISFCSRMGLWSWLYALGACPSVHRPVSSTKYRAVRRYSSFPVTLYSLAKAISTMGCPEGTCFCPSSGPNTRHTKSAFLIATSNRERLPVAR